MKKYKLVSQYGNRVIYTDSEKEKTELIEKGYHIHNPEIKTTQTAKKRGAVRKNEGKS